MGDTYERSYLVLHDVVLVRERESREDDKMEGEEGEEDDDDELEGLDENELDQFILSEEEVRIKERVWVEINRDYLEAIASEFIFLVFRYYCRFCGLHSCFVFRT